jgi:hypothetical protein
LEKHVIINVTSVQRDETGKDEKITLETSGAPETVLPVMRRLLVRADTM